MSAISLNLGKVDSPGIRRVPGHDDLGLALKGQPLHLVVVHALRLFVHAVGREVVELAGEVHRAAVGQVPALVQPHAQHRVSRLQHGEVCRHVGLRPAVGLHVDVLRPEQRASPVDSQLLGDVHVLAAAVVSTPGIALGVLVGQH